MPPATAAASTDPTCNTDEITNPRTAPTTSPRRSLYASVATSNGIGSAIATVIAANHPVPMAFVGVQDVFGESGEAEELLRKYGLTAESIVAAAHKVTKRKRR
jgi:transketolase